MCGVSKRTVQNKHTHKMNEEENNTEGDEKADALAKLGAFLEKKATEECGLPAFQKQREGVRNSLIRSHL